MLKFLKWAKTSTMTFAERPIYYLLCALQHSVEPSRNPTVSILNLHFFHIRNSGFEKLGSKIPCSTYVFVSNKDFPRKVFHWHIPKQNDTVPGFKKKHLFTWVGGGEGESWGFLKENTCGRSKALVSLLRHLSTEVLFKSSQIKGYCWVWEFFLFAP
jgi:hypothetical protein